LAQVFEELHCFLQAFDAIDGNAVAGDGGFHRVVARQDDAGELPHARQQRGWQTALYTLHAAVQRQFAEHQVPMQVVALERVVGCDQTQRDRKVEGRAFLARVRGGEIHGEATIGEVVAGVFDCRLDAVQGFARGSFSQTDRGEARKAAGDIDLDLDRERVNAGQCARHHAGEQTVSPPFWWLPTSRHEQDKR